MTYEARVTAAKQEQVSAIRAQLEQGRDYIFTDYRGLNVGQIAELRSRLREQQVNFRVVKNRYTKLAFKELQLPDISAFLIGPTGLAIATDDAAPAFKVLLQFESTSPLSIKGSLVGGTLYDQGQTRIIANLPSRDELIAQLMATMIAPLRQFGYCLNGVTRKLAATLQAIADKKKNEN